MAIAGGAACSWRQIQETTNISPLRPKIYFFFMDYSILSSVRGFYFQGELRSLPTAAPNRVYLPLADNKHAHREGTTVFGHPYILPDCAHV